mmetsp:Transcript_843/g.2124  ORF Transcript_843/g.2124 Transcript_843/m.2124 type:complete len:214 (-) Transcript_843:583-1224(-)
MRQATAGDARVPREAERLQAAHAGEVHEPLVRQVVVAPGPKVRIVARVARAEPQLAEASQAPRAKQRGQLDDAPVVDERRLPQVELCQVGAVGQEGGVQHEDVALQLRGEHAAQPQGAQCGAPHSPEVHTVVPQQLGAVQQVQPRQRGQLDQHRLHRLPGKATQLGESQGREAREAQQAMPLNVAAAVQVQRLQVWQRRERLQPRVGHQHIQP